MLLHVSSAGNAYNLIHCCRMDFGDWSENSRGTYNKWDGIARSTAQVYSYHMTWQMLCMFSFMIPTSIQHSPICSIATYVGLSGCMDGSFGLPRQCWNLESENGKPWLMVSWSRNIHQSCQPRAYKQDRVTNSRQRPILRRPCKEAKVCYVILLSHLKQFLVCQILMSIFLLISGNR